MTNASNELAYLIQIQVAHRVDILSAVLFTANTSPRGVGFIAPQQQKRQVFTPKQPA
jgi:hypothetical protein